MELVTAEIRLGLADRIGLLSCRGVSFGVLGDRAFIFLGPFMRRIAVSERFSVGVALLELVWFVERILACTLSDRARSPHSQVIPPRQKLSHALSLDLELRFIDVLTR